MSVFDSGSSCPEPPTDSRGQSHSAIVGNSVIRTYGRITKHMSFLFPLRHRIVWSAFKSTLGISIYCYCCCCCFAAAMLICQWKASCAMTKMGSQLLRDPSRDQLSASCSTNPERSVSGRRVSCCVFASGVFQVRNKPSQIPCDSPVSGLRGSERRVITGRALLLMSCPA